ncbi:hypothetical protein [Thalassospira mesophila]|uniref:hypothetical protein n=1 Tax=Thalassospira mesophila TaxID=1293891 RepID=UPI00117DCE4A|nr:hypothetical protein [Thalassospira mesophila]
MKIVCPHCHTVSNLGVAVCVGCQAEVVYGSTFSEVKSAATFGAIAAGVVSSVIMVKFFSFSFVLLVVCAFIGALCGRAWAQKAHLDETRFFRLFLNK